MPRGHTSKVKVQVYKMAERSGGSSTEKLLAPCAKRKTPQRKLAKDHDWLGVQKKNGIFREW